MQGYDFRFRLLDVKPVVWRDVVVPVDFTFDMLSEIIQVVFGFNGFHSYDFYIKEVGERIVSFDDALEVLPGEIDSNVAVIGDYFDKYGSMKYTYDFDDDWEFIVEVRDKVDDVAKVPVVIGFQGDYNLIEDCGGPMVFDTILQKNFTYADGESNPVLEEEIDSFLDDTFDKYDIDEHSIESIVEKGLNDDVTDDFDKFLGTLLNNNLLAQKGDGDMLNNEVSGFFGFMENLAVVFDKELESFMDSVYKRYDIEDLDEVEDSEIADKIELEFDDFMNNFLAKYMLKNEFDNVISAGGGGFFDDFKEDLVEFDLDNTQGLLNKLFEDL